MGDYFDWVRRWPEEWPSSAMRNKSMLRRLLAASFMEAKRRWLGPFRRRRNFGCCRICPFSIFLRGDHERELRLLAAAICLDGIIDDGVVRRAGRSSCAQGGDQGVARLEASPCRIAAPASGVGNALLLTTCIIVVLLASAIVVTVVLVPGPSGQTVSLSGWSSRQEVSGVSKGILV